MIVFVQISARCARVVLPLNLITVGATVLQVMVVIITFAKHDSLSIKGAMSDIQLIRQIYLTNEILPCAELAA